MIVLSPLNFGILLIAQGAFGIPWSAKPAARYEGYDLERGPVLYEAYYPEERAEVENSAEPREIYQEKRYFDRISVPERSYQIPTDPYELPYESADEEPENNAGYFPPISGYTVSAFTRAKPQTIRKNGYVTHELQGNRQYVFAEEPAVRQSANDYKSFAGPEAASYFGERNKEGLEFVDENRMRFGGDDVQRIVPINDEFVFGEQPVIVKVPDSSKSFGNFESHRDYVGEKEMESLPMENIFQPRPQTLKYVFSSPKISTDFKPVEFATETEDNDWPRNYGDNLLQGEIKKADEQDLKNQEAKVSSIEVSQVSHHKIRHHHGERAKRNYGHN